MTLRIVTWNLFHGRAVPPAGRDLFAEFAGVLAGWRWDAALLQEVPPWWPPGLAEACGAKARVVLTSRNAALPLRRAVAVRRPDLIKSNGGGANAILVRHQDIAEHRTLRLCRWPERRWLHAVRLSGGPWIGNLHLSVRRPERARLEAGHAARALQGWAAGAPVVLGGDFNLRRLTLPGLRHVGGNDVDHVFERDVGAPNRAPVCEVLEHGRLSDHAPVLVELL